MSEQSQGRKRSRMTMSEQSQGRKRSLRCLTAPAMRRKEKVRWTSQERRMEPRRDSWCLSNHATDPHTTLVTFLSQGCLSSQPSKAECRLCQYEEFTRRRTEGRSTARESRTERSPVVRI